MRKAVVGMLIVGVICTLPGLADAQDTAACCFGSYCIELEEGECDSLGGDWYEDQTCSFFGCPSFLIEQRPNTENGLFSDLECDFCGGIQIIAENFTIQERLHIQRIVFFGNNFPSLDPQSPDCIDIIFREDDAGLPGDEIARLSCTVPSRIEPFVGSQILLYVLDISEEEVVIGAGTFFIEIYNDTESDPDSWFWVVGNLNNEYGLPGQAFTFTVPEEPWSYDDYTDLAIFIDGEAALSADENSNPVPAHATLFQSYPNPFNAITTLRIDIQNATQVRINIYNVLGRMVTTLFDGNIPSGSHTITWDAGDLPSGIYFARLESGVQTQSIRMVLLK